MIQSRRLRAAAVFAACLALTTGCGSSAPSPSAVPEQPAGAVPAAQKAAAKPAPKVSAEPLKIIVDGQEVKLQHAYAVGWGQGRYVVHYFNHDKVTCEQLLAPSRQTSADEIEVRASAARGGGLGDGIGTGAFAQLGLTGIRLVKEATAVGEPVQIGLEAPVQITPTNGPWKDKQVTVSGLFEGKFCGERS